ncbi:MAG: hypothetical protein GOU97_03840 [Nanoarchaeota archaeon]|nr:hypothetical protein [Nanoarchaeota archaeon]
MSVDIREYDFKKVNGWKVYQQEVDGLTYPIGWKVVTEDLKSTGLNGTPVVQYSQDEWKHHKEWGIWVARIPSFADYVKWHLSNRERNPSEGKIFVTAMDDVIEARKNGVKSKGILLLEEMSLAEPY